MRRQLVLCAGVLVLLSGCGGVGNNAREVLGMDHRAPDAFSVSTHAPLQVPPNLNAALPLPQPGAPRPQDVTPQSSARTVLTGGTLPAPVNAAAPSAAERVVLQQAGAAATDPAIRARVNAEAAEDADDQRGSLDWLVFWRPTPRPGVAVNAEAEAARLKANREAGRPVTQGATPVTEDSGRLSVPKEIE